MRNVVSADDFSEFVAEFCATNDKPVVILIDEVDQAGNNDSFIKFLATLRNMYLARAKVPTFQSVILERFVSTFNEIYGERGERFLEEEGRRYFMLYVKPIINGTGNYYIEAVV